MKYYKATILDGDRVVCVYGQSKNIYEFNYGISKQYPKASRCNISPSSKIEYIKVLEGWKI